MRPAVWLVAVMVVVVAVAACGGDDDDAGTGDATATATQAAGVTDDAGGDDGGSSSAEGIIEIDAADFSFSPNGFTVVADAELLFAVSNTGDSPHTLNLYQDEDYTQPVEGASTGTIETVTIGQFNVTLPAGEYYFRCELHPDRMTGTIAAQ